MPEEAPNGFGKWLGWTILHFKHLTCHSKQIMNRQCRNLKNIKAKSWWMDFNFRLLPSCKAWRYTTTLWSRPILRNYFMRHNVYYMKYLICFSKTVLEQFGNLPNYVIWNSFVIKLVYNYGTY